MGILFLPGFSLSIHHVCSASLLYFVGSFVHINLYLNVPGGLIIPWNRCKRRIIIVGIYTDVWNGAKQYPVKR